MSETENINITIAKIKTVLKIKFIRWSTAARIWFAHSVTII